MNPNTSRAQAICKPVTRGQAGMVSAQCHAAARAGADILEAGGTALDAAIAASFVAGVTEPWMSGPLGGGAMIVARPSQPEGEAILFNPRSLRATRPDMYPLDPGREFEDLLTWPAVVDDRNVFGPLSVATPGLVAGLALAHNRHGRMPWRELLAPGILAARQGVPLDWYSSLVIATKAQDLARDPHTAGLYLRDGTWPRTTFWTDAHPGTIPQPKAAATLEHLAEAGPGDFYNGDIAGQLLEDAKDQGIPLAADDLSTYKATVLPTLQATAGACTMFLTPGLTGGPSLCDARDRMRNADDFSFAGQRAALLAATGHRRAAMGHNADQSSSDCTTHISVVDKDGMLVSLTQTLLSVFGACLLAPRSGFLFNNGMLWFDPRPGGPNAIAPGQPCLMNVSPVIGQTPQGRFALGACGGRKILPAMFQITSQLLDRNATLEAAMTSPRIDPISQDLTLVDPQIPEKDQRALACQSRVELRQPSAFPVYYGSAVGVMQTPEGFEGCTEFHSPWADSVAPVATKQPVSS